MSLQFKGNESSAIHHLASFARTVAHEKKVNPNINEDYLARQYVENEVKAEEGMAEYAAWENERARRNNRLLRAIKRVSTRTYYKVLEEVIYDSGGIEGQAEIVKEPMGVFQKHDYCRVIPGIWVDQWRNGGFTGDDFAGYVYVKIKEGKYFKFQYSM